MTEANSTIKSQGKSIILKSPKEFTELKNQWRVLKHCLLQDESLREYADELVNYYQPRIDASCYAFKPQLVEKSRGEIDRLGETLRGPVYSCKKYEWPMESGQPMTPLIQLNLTTCSTMGNEKLGDGLLQVFVGHEKFMPWDAIVRVIPKNEVSLDKLLPIPFFDSNIKPFAKIDWAFDAQNLGGDKNPALQIEGYASPIFCMHPLDAIDERTDVEDLISIGFGSEEIKRFNHSIAICLDKFQTDGSHLFGTFSPIQYQASERGKALFCFEEEDGFNFGMGNGQIFFEKGKRSKSMIFSFDWSCS